MFIYIIYNTFEIVYVPSDISVILYMYVHL